MMLKEVPSVMLPIQSNVDLGALIQGVVAALVIIGVAILYFDRMSKISHSIDNVSSSASELSESVDKIEEKVTQVDLKDMERTITTLDYIIKNGGDDGYHGGRNTVYHTLEQTQIEVAISYATTHPEATVHESNELHAKIEEEMSDESSWGRTTVIDLEFDEEINTMALMDLLRADNELANQEEETFGKEASMRARSPYEIRLHVQTDNFSKIADWIPEYLDTVDKYLTQIRETTDEFDEVLAAEVNGGNSA